MSVICLQIGLGCDHLTPEWKRDKAFQCLNIKRISEQLHTLWSLWYRYIANNCWACLCLRNWLSTLSGLKELQVLSILNHRGSDGNICLNFAVQTALEQTLTFIYSYKRQSLTLSEENRKIKRVQELLWPRSLHRQHFRLVDGNYAWRALLTEKNYAN